MADTELQQLVINVGTKAQIEAGISGGTITQDMLSVATDSTDYVTDVQVDSTSVTTNGVANIDLTGKLDKVSSANKVYGTDSNGDQTTYNKDSFGQVDDVQVNGVSVVTSKVANVPKASNSTLGVVQTNGSYGIEISSSGYIATIPAAEATLVAKVNGRNVVVANNLDIAVREGLGNNSLTWSDTYKSNARTTIGAVGDVQVNGTSITTSGVANIPVATNQVFGVVKPVPNYGLSSLGNDTVGISDAKAGGDATITSKTSAYRPLTPRCIDLATKVGVTTNTITLTTSEQETACNWLGASQQTIFRDWN